MSAQLETAPAAMVSSSTTVRMNFYKAGSIPPSSLLHSNLEVLAKHLDNFMLEKMSGLFSGWKS